MNKYSVWICVAAIGALATMIGTAAIQDKEKPDPGNTAAQDPAEQDTTEVVVEFETTYNDRHLKKEPLLGAAISDLTAIDENGNEFDFTSTQGKYTVVVFGCLT